MSKAFLRGNVIRILDAQRILINLGMEQGVKLGDRFYVYETGDEIRETSSGESLGNLELVKAELEAVLVQEKMTLLMPPRKTLSESGTVLSAVLARTYYSGTQGSDLSRDQLNVRQEQVSGLKQISPIALGDKVRSAAAIEK